MLATTSAIVCMSYSWALQYGVRDVLVQLPLAAALQLRSLV